MLEEREYRAAQQPEGIRPASQDLIDAVDELGGRWLITADHGNVEEMVQRDKQGKPLLEDGKPVPLTSHTLNPVSILLICISA